MTDEKEVIELFAPSTILDVVNQLDALTNRIKAFGLLLADQNNCEDYINTMGNLIFEQSEELSKASDTLI